jgi:hypothetical protein
MPQQLFEHHRRLEKKASARFECRSHCAEKRLVAVVVEVAEAVANAKGTVESFRPRQLAHVALLPRGTASAPAIRSASCSVCSAGTASSHSWTERPSKKSSHQFAGAFVLSCLLMTDLHPNVRVARTDSE